MPDEYDAVRKNLTRYERGLYFELGRAHLMGETRARGWESQYGIRVGRNSRVLDSALPRSHSVKVAVERKSGRVNERDALRQLELERFALKNRQIERSYWETVAGEKVSPRVTREMQDMSRDFGDRFHHREVSRADAVRAIREGQSLASRQLELYRSNELIRADRARKRLEHIRSIVRARERADRLARAQQFREAAARGRTEAAKNLRERDQQRQREIEQRSRSLTDRQRIEREAAQRVAREFRAEWDARECREQAAESARKEHEREAEERAREERETTERSAERLRGCTKRTSVRWNDCPEM